MSEIPSKQAGASETAPQSAGSRSASWLPFVAVGLALTVAIIWSYWTNFAAMANKWSRDPQYSHGYLVPLFSAVLLWLRRDRLGLEGWRPSWWWGMPILLGGLALRFVGAHFYFESLEFLSLLPVLAGSCLLVGGTRAFRWSWPAIAFLFFMLPLPYSLEVALRDPLRTVGTKTSTYLMQTLGLPAVAEGHVIVVDNIPIGVEEACSGLRMLMVFFALSTAVCLLSERPLWERALILVSAVPIAVITNVLRITVTGVLHVTVGSEIANMVFHDLAGWLMMPVALVLLGGELWLLSHLFIVEEDQPLSVGIRDAVAAQRDANSDAPMATITSTR